MDDRELLRRYAMGEAGAFGELVRRHRDWVYSVCLRRLGDEGLAEDATQVVFLALARGAGRVARHPRVLGWLHRVSRFTALKIRREALRRERREREVGAMGTTAEVSVDWEAMRGVIEEAMDRLSAGEREAVLLRFYRQLPHAEVGRALGVSEEAAKKRVNRALERLRGMVGARGVRVTGAGIGAALLAHGVVRVPVALGEVVAAGGTGASGQVQVLTRGVLQMMRRAKLAMPAGVAIGVAVMVVLALPLVKRAGRVVAAGPAESVVATGPTAAAVEVRELTEQWHFSSENGDMAPADLSDPVAEKGVVYFGDSRGAVRAVNVMGKKALWETAVPGIVYSVGVDDQRVYASGEKGLAALAKGTGAAAWRLDVAGGTGDCVRDPVTEKVYVGGMDGVLYALDRNTGEKKWTHSLLDAGVRSSPQARLSGPARPTGISTDGVRVYQSIFDQSRLIACDAGTGEERWSFVAEGWIHGAAAFDGEHVFIGAQDQYLYCLAKETGERVWRYRTKSRIESTPMVSGEMVYFTSCDGMCYAVKISTGELAWKFRVDRDERRGGSAIYSTPLLCRGTVWFAAGEGHVYGLNPADGKLMFKFCPSEESDLYSSVAADETSLFVTSRQRNGHNSIDGPASGENAVFAFGLRAGE